MPSSSNIYALIFGIILGVLLALLLAALGLGFPGMGANSPTQIGFSSNNATFSDGINGSETGTNPGDIILIEGAPVPVTLGLFDDSSTLVSNDTGDEIEYKIEVFRSSDNSLVTSATGTFESGGAIAVTMLTVSIPGTTADTEIQFKVTSPDIPGFGGKTVDAILKPLGIITSTVHVTVLGVLADPEKPCSPPDWTTADWTVNSPTISNITNLITQSSPAQDGLVMLEFIHDDLQGTALYNGTVTLSSTSTGNGNAPPPYYPDFSVQLSQNDSRMFKYWEGDGQNSIDSVVHFVTVCPD